MKKLALLLTLMGLMFNAQYSMLKAQTLNVTVGSVTYQFPAAQAGDMTYADGQTLTIMGKVFAISDITTLYVDDTEVTDNQVNVVYTDDAAHVYVPGNVALYVDPSVEGAHISMAQSTEVSADNVGEITYSLSGTSSDGEFYLSGNYKSTLELCGLTLINANPVFSGAAIHVQNGKRIDISVKKESINTLTDSASGSQKSCLYVKGHAEFKGQGTLNVYGKAAHAVKAGDYITLRKCTLNILSAAKDGISCNGYFIQESGQLAISGAGDDAVQVDIDATESTGQTTDHEDEDSGNIYVEGGKLTMTVTADACKGLKSAGDITISGGTVSVTQTGSIITTDDDISYPTSIKANGNITISGGTVTINNTANGGKGISADGSITISQDSLTTVIDITANGAGGTAETSGGSGDNNTTSSYNIFVSLPTSGEGGGNPFGGGGSSAWKTLYLYKSDGTLVQQLTSTVSKSSGYTTTTFYSYDFKIASTDTYYFQSDNYTSRGTTYTIKSTTFSGPSSGSDLYYSISNSYTTSGSTRTYQLTNATNTYGGTSTDTSEEEGTGYNAIGLKADSSILISGGMLTIKNKGEMSKSIKSKGTVTIDGGNITLTPSGSMRVINNDASYSSGIKTADFVQNSGSLTINASGAAGRGITATNITTNGGTLKITNSGVGQTGTNGSYTAKGLKADTKIALGGGTINISMTGTGGKGIKSSGTYTQGTSGGSGPTLTVSTTGSSLGEGSSGGVNPFGGRGQQSSGGSSAKAIKVQGTVYLYGGTSEITTETDGAEGLESKTAVYIEGGKHYFACYDDCINSSGNIYFNGGIAVCYSDGNDAVDSNAERSGAITIGNGVVLAYTSAGGPEEGLDCDANSYIQITGTGIAISAGGSQGGGGGFGGSSSNTISNAKQGYYFCTSSISYKTNNYYTLADSSGKNLVTYSLESAVTSSLALLTATGMVKGSDYTLKYSTTAPTDATTAFHGLYLGSTAVGTTEAIMNGFTAQ
ncbi:MAG: carbohydrate-binding domain-containing protein [Bacteroidaceae bacterium]|nr:carbohydrate-binding domain-containing protein [Bacteroidaceae bacterium]